MQEGYLDVGAGVGSAKLWYRDHEGTGEPVVLLHAATGHAGFFDDSLWPAFTRAGYRPIVYDRRGYGRTECDAGSVSAGTAADDLVALADHLGLGRFHLMGTAAGGIIALDFSLSAAARLASLVVANSLGGAQDADYLALSNGLRPPQFNALPEDFKELGPEFRAAQPERLARWRELARTTLAGGQRAPSQPMKNRITFSALAALDLPVLFVTGEADLYSPPATVRRYVETIRGAEFLGVSLAGHSVYWEQPDIFNRAVLDFLSRRGRR
jgi:pimeloyl-ACP methyl ester carboxylesterase